LLNYSNQINNKKRATKSNKEKMPLLPDTDSEEVSVDASFKRLNDKIITRSRILSNKFSFYKYKAEINMV
jgi:hypothetical protein